MLRISLICLILLMTILCSIMTFVKYTRETSPQSKLAGLQQDLSKDMSKVPVSELPPVVKEINSRSLSTNNISCEDIDVKVWMNGHRYKLTGSINYEKPLFFRMIINSLFGKEVDIGSNDKHFWYWSRRDKKPGLYYALHEDLQKTRLKNPFNPLFLRASLAAEELPAKDCKVVEKGDNLMLVYPRQSASGQPLLFAVFVNKSRKQIDGYILTNSNGQTLATCDIQEYAGSIPTKILYTWYEENHVMLVTLKRPKMNSAIDPSVWQMPNHTPKKNMAEGY